MRGKRSKKYRKLMQQYGLHFGFREPYQVLLDAEILLEAARCRMNFSKMLEHTLHGQIKPMITQCCMRHLYAAEPKNDLVIAHAKQFERRRCNHHILEKPLTTLECLSSVVDPKGSRTNKHRYVVATQDREAQEHMQLIPGVPLVYVLRSVMIMKPMSDVTVQTRARDEAQKFKVGLKGSRRAELAASKPSEESVKQGGGGEAQDRMASQERSAPKKKRGQTSGANPLSAKAPSKAKLAEKSRSGQQSSGSTRRKRKKAFRMISNDTTEVAPAVLPSGSP